MSLLPYFLYIIYYIFHHRPHRVIPRLTLVYPLLLFFETMDGGREGFTCLYIYEQLLGVSSLDMPGALHNGSYCDILFFCVLVVCDSE